MHYFLVSVYKNEFLCCCNASKQNKTASFIPPFEVCILIPSVGEPSCRMFIVWHRLLSHLEGGVSNADRGSYHSVSPSGLPPLLSVEVNPFLRPLICLLLFQGKQEKAPLKEELDFCFSKKTEKFCL